MYQTRYNQKYIPPAKLALRYALGEEFEVNILLGSLGCQELRDDDSWAPTAKGMPYVKCSVTGSMRVNGQPETVLLWKEDILEAFAEGTNT